MEVGHTSLELRAGPGDHPDCRLESAFLSHADGENGDRRRGARSHRRHPRPARPRFGRHTSTGD